jgi:DNA (cytosine-5)-methyltransferase 1
MKKPALKKNNTKKFTFIDLFAGVGGIRLPLEELGGECVFTSELDKFAQKTYTANYGPHGLHGDITKVTNDQVPRHDILVGGFPCQAFSISGKRLGFQDTRGTLFFEIARLVEAKQPKMLVLENVKGLVSHDQGRTFQTILGVLDGLGYEVSYQVLSAKDFGLPQNRPRIFIVGVRKDQGFKFIFPPLPKSKPTRLGDILEEQVDPKYTLSPRAWAGLKDHKRRHQEAGHGFGYNLYDEHSLVVGTLKARYHKDGSEILVKQKHKPPRRLTPRECARLQGFPDTMPQVVSDSQFYKQMGNSVAVPVLRWIFQHLLKQAQAHQK